MTPWEALLYFWLSLPPALPYDAPLPRYLQTGSILRTDALHVGVRPHSDSPDGAAMTVQITALAITL